ncbi:MAG: hypothetical protein KAH57_08250 [Thermoplasmata archaeon]|nr:hypothetical protein [Thermoplasmata archaeon]
MERTVKLSIILYGTILFVVIIRLSLLFLDLNPYSYLPFFLLLAISLSITARYLKGQGELERYQMESRQNMDRKIRFKRTLR